MKPDWAYWRNLVNVSLWDAVWLSLGIQPYQDDVTGYARDEDPHVENDHSSRFRIAYSHAGNGYLPAKRGQQDYLVNLGEFRKWGESLPVPFTFPSEFPMQTAMSLPTAGRWPWGDYETDLLRKLAAAAEKFWKLYDPDDQSTAITSETVTKWLEDQGVSKRVAEIMAQILRADGLKTGPRQ